MKDSAAMTSCGHCWRSSPEGLAASLPDQLEAFDDQAGYWQRRPFCDATDAVSLFNVAAHATALESEAPIPFSRPTVVVLRDSISLLARDAGWSSRSPGQA